MRRCAVATFGHLRLSKLPQVFLARLVFLGSKLSSCLGGVEVSQRLELLVSKNRQIARVGYSIGMRPRLDFLGSKLSSCLGGVGGFATP